MAIEITELIFEPDELRSDPPASGKGVSNKDYIDNTLIVAKTVAEAKTFDYDSLEDPFNRKLIFIAGPGQEPKNLFIYFPLLGAVITTDSPLLIKTTSTATPGALVRIDTSKIAATSAELTEFENVTSFLGNSWTIQYQTDDNSLQLLFAGIKQRVLYDNIVDGGVDAGNAKIINQKDPDNDQDGSTKKYVDTSISNIYKVGAYLNTNSGPLTQNVWMDITYPATPYLGVNNPVISVVGKDLTIPAGKYILSFDYAVEDNGAANTNTNVLFRLLDSSLAVIPRGSSAFYTYGGNTSIPYTSNNEIYAEFSTQQVLSSQIQVSQPNWIFLVSTISLSIRNIG